MSNRRHPTGMKAAMQKVDAKLPTDTLDLVFDAIAVREITRLEEEIAAADLAIVDLDQRIQFISLGDKDLRYGDESPVDDLQTKKADRLAEVDRLTDELETVRSGVQTLTVTLRAMPFGKWAALRTAHPPVMRKVTGPDGKVHDQVIDEDMLGVHAETFFPLAVRECIVEPSVAADEDWQYFIEGAQRDNPDDPDADGAEDEGGGLPAGEWYRLCIRIWGLNGRTLDVPKSRMTSGGTQTPGAE